jgi:beta-lactam-binding protein with PASTA domain
MSEHDQGVVVPSVEGLFQEEAVAALSAVGLSPTILELHSLAQPGTVFYQSPAAGSTWSVGDLEPIEIWISIGPEEHPPEPRAAIPDQPPGAYGEQPTQAGPDLSGGVDGFGPADEDSDGL